MGVMSLFSFGAKASGRRCDPHPALTEAAGHNTFKDGLARAFRLDARTELVEVPALAHRPQPAARCKAQDQATATATRAPPKALPPNSTECGGSTRPHETQQCFWFDCAAANLEEANTSEADAGVDDEACCKFPSISDVAKTANPESV